MSDIFNLKGFESVFDSSLANEVLDNMVEFFDWGLLQKGNYFNVSLGELNSAGQDMSKLSVDDNKLFTPGTTWKGMRPNWVWQHGITYDPAPTTITGIYVDDVFYPSNTVGAYAHYIDYYNGRVIFESAIPTTSKVQVEHSYKWINVKYANSFDGMKVLESEDSQSLPPELVINLPVIAIEVHSRPTPTGYQLGGGQFVETIILFHCIAQNDIMRDRMVDIVSFQNDKTIYMFNSNQMGKNGEFPLDGNGTPIENALNYPEMVTKYPRNSLRLTKALSSEMIMKNNSFFGGVVKMSAEVVKLAI